MTYIMTVGLNDKNTKTQLVTTEEAEAMIAEYIAANFLGGTLYPCKGVYKHENGVTVKENSFTILLANITREDATKAADFFKLALNQESIGILPINAEMDFV